LLALKILLLNCYYCCFGIENGEEISNKETDNETKECNDDDDDDEVIGKACSLFEGFRSSSNIS
jgi:hypothetical protein